MIDTRKELQENIKREFDKFLKFSTSDKSTVTSALCMLFAEHIHELCQSVNDKRECSYKAACDEWLHKTEWVQETIKPKELGLHRADILKSRIDDLLAVIEVQRQALKYYADGGHITHLSNGECSFEYGDVAKSALAIKPEDMQPCQPTQP